MTNKTTIILGAGASVDYGYPTGNELIDLIVSRDLQRDRTISSFLNRKEVLQAHEFCINLEKFDPISIDRYLAQHSNNPELVHIGKVLITCEIIRRQAPSKFTRNNKNNWYKYLFDYVFEDNNFEKKITNDEFRIITFNYDLSLEYFFHSRLEQIPSLNKDQAWNIFRAFNKKIHHIYGSVYDYENVYNEGFNGIQCISDESETRYNFINRAIANDSLSVPIQNTTLRIIGEERSLTETPEIQYLRSFLASSERIFIFGFGFDSVNCDIIGLNKNNLSSSRKEIFSTNMGDIPIIKQKIMRLGEEKIDPYEGRNIHKITISTGGVNQALCNDFLLKAST